MSSQLMERPTTVTGYETHEAERLLPSAADNAVGVSTEVPAKQLLRWQDDGGAIHSDVA